MVGLRGSRNQIGIDDDLELNAGLISKIYISNFSDNKTFFLFSCNLINDIWKTERNNKSLLTQSIPLTSRADRFRASA